MKQGIVRMPTITFLSDFGLVDEYVAVCKGVILDIAPEANIIDVSHEIPPFDVKKGALVLADALPYLPGGVHLAVVDPGVGTKRRPIALKTPDGNILVGPDNGLLVYAAALAGGPSDVVEIAEERYMRPTECMTFHGRDVFAPVAAHLAAGVALDKLGPRLDPKTLAPVPWPEPRREDHSVVCEVIDIDRFGTVRLNAHADQLETLDVGTDHPLDVAFGHHQLTLPVLCTFGDVPLGEPLLLFDSSNLLCLALNQASAADRYDTSVGDRVTLRKG